jgi:protein-S-isoprenylcysteine O-methyltransferase Ste14
MIWLKTLLFTVIAPGTLTVIIPYWLSSTNIGNEKIDLGALRILGGAPLLMGIAVYLRCVTDFIVKGRGTPAPYDPPKHLVMNGLYRFVRNPMYIGIVLILLGEAVFFERGILFALAAIVFFGFHLRVLYYEEPALRRSFGESYARYCAAAPRWLPRRPHGPQALI